MVQVFGNRILGGIGAPGGGMSESFGAGVNTALNQRASRQAMVGEGQRQSILAQEQAFRIEDRAAAKKRQAAAEAAAATARARAAATAAAVAAAGNGTGPKPFFDSNALRTPGVVTRPPSTIPLAFGVPAGAAGGTVSGGGGTAALGGGAGSDTLGVAGPSFETRGRGQAGVAVSPMTLGQMSSARPGNYQAQATARNMQEAAANQGARITAAEMMGQAGGITGTLNIPAMEAYIDDLTKRIGTEIKARQSGVPRFWFQGEDLDMLLAERARMDAELEAVKMQPARVGLVDRGATAEEGAGSSVAARLAGEAAARAAAVQGPNRPPPLPLEGPGFEAVGRGNPPTAAPPVQTPVPPSPELGFGGVAPLETSLAGGTSFGPKLGAVATPTEMFYADMGYTPAGQLDLQAIMDKQELIQDPAFSQIAEQQRVSYIYAAEDALARGDTAGYIEAQKQIKTQEMLILAQQVMAGANEATNFDSTKRLSLAASMIEGVDIVLVPKGDGNVDVYVNEQLDDANIPIQSIVDQLRARVDSAYIEQMSTAAAEDQSAQREIYIANEKARYESALTIQRQELANQLADELDLAGKVNAVTVELMRQTMIADGLLPADTPELKIETNSLTGGFVVINPQTGAPVTQYVPNPNGDGSLVEQRPE